MYMTYGQFQAKLYSVPVETSTSNGAWIGGWVGRRAGLKAVVKKKF